jgi:two-component system, chemotaxis family, CheB/CheR fusion protein
LRSEARQRLLIAELQHRTRNLLAVVQSVAQQTLGKGGSLDGFTARLAALGRVQSLVGGAMEDHIDLGEIVHLELQAVGAADGKVSISGPQVRLGFELVQTLGLALHELATNAVKYGALKVETGRIDISWTIRGHEQDGPVLALDWLETGVPCLSPPTRSGFGRELIEKALRFTLRAKTKLSFGLDGVSCHIELPLAQPAAEQAASGPEE